MSIFQDYYNKANTFAVFPNDKSARYINLGLIDELGEACGKVKKIIRDTDLDVDRPDLWPDDKKQAVILELGDFCWYLVMKTSQFIEETIALDENEQTDPVDHDKRDEIADTIWGIIEEKYQTFIVEIYSSDNTFYFDRTLVFMGNMLKFVCNESDLFYGDKSVDIDKLVGAIITLFALVNVLAEKLGSNIQDVFDQNIAKLTSRSERNQLHGSGDYR